MEESLDVIGLLRSQGLLGSDESATVTPMAGGVSCDVWAVAGEDGHAYAVKRALPQLRVATEWLAPVERAESEVRWLRAAGAIVPGAVPRVIAALPDRHLFVMDYLDPASHPVWKEELIAGRVDPGFASAVGATLGRIHAATAGDAEIATAFQTGALFHALRVDPFLLYVAERDTGAAPRLRELAADLGAHKLALVHGDVSPKNILCGPAGPVFLDAECAVYGDPAFDLAFCLTHLLLKAMWLKPHATALMDSADALVGGYRPAIEWEAADALERRAGGLVAALLLARVDGKSPAPYLTADADRVAVRASARRLLDAAPALTRLLATWRTETVQ